MDIDGLSEDVALPDDPRSLNDFLESLAKFAEQRAARMWQVAEWMQETRINGDVTSVAEELATRMDGLVDAAEEVYEVFLEYYPPEFWLKDAG
jgi:hypothetical protein